MIKFMKRECYPFARNLIEHDDVLKSITTDDEHDVLVCGMLQSCFNSINLYQNMTRLFARRKILGYSWHERIDYKLSTAQQKP